MVRAKPIPSSAPIASTRASALPKSVANSSFKKATPTPSFRLPRPSGPSSTPWDISPRRWPRHAQKKLPETDAIFEQLREVNQAADDASDVLRISMDAKATVKIGPFSRGGKSRVAVAAADHDFQAEAAVTPVGIFLPATDELFLSLVTSKVTSDCLVDRLEQWWERVRARCAHITTLVVNLDNGPENHSRRTQFMLRLLEFAQKSGLTLRLAYYPPYHSKYNPVERCWGILENHWNGSLLD